MREIYNSRLRREAIAYKKAQRKQFIIDLLEFTAGVVLLYITTVILFLL